MSLEQTNIIDALGIDDASGRVTFVIRHDAPWDGSSPQLYLLQEKLNAYLSFALDGEMAETFPDFVQKPLTLRIDTTSAPDSRTLHFLAHVRRQLEFQDIPVEVRITQPPGEGGQGCGDACECREGT